MAANIDTVADTWASLFRRHLTSSSSTSSGSSATGTGSDGYYDFFTWGSWSGGGSSNATGNYTAPKDFDSQLVAPQDVPVDAVLTSIYLNSIVCLVLLTSYELLRRLLPTVYSSREKLIITRPQQPQSPAASTDKNRNTNMCRNSNHPSPTNSQHEYHAFDDEHLDDKKKEQEQTLPESTISQDNSLFSLPDDRPFNWVGPVFGVPWSAVRKTAGLDAYFFLRYIRMNVRITAVSTFWFFCILVPIYATGQPSDSTDALQQGWYHISAANIQTHGWRMWVLVVFAYLFAAFIAFVIKQEYRHFLEVTQDFLARGSPHVNPQHHYSLLIESIPFELRSDSALKDYFDKLYPGKVHSASVVLKLPDLEDASIRCNRTVRRLEKSIAYLHATGKRPEHIVGRARLTVLGVDLEPWDCSCGDDGSVYVEDARYAERPERGTRVDSISYYTQELAANSRALFKIQQRKVQIAESGNMSIKADNWLDQAVRNFTMAATQIMDDSAIANDLKVPDRPSQASSPEILAASVPRAEKMTSQYGSFSSATIGTPFQPFPDKDGLMRVAHDYVSP
jgi:hypothetical protein